MSIIDFRSDTVTRPGEGMRQRMYEAEVGDDVYGDDPSVNALEARVADLLGHEAAMLVPSGTQSNLIALLTHCGRGDEYIVGQHYHTYFYESGGAASLGGIVPQPLPELVDGSLDLAQVEAHIKPRDIHFARSRLLSLENTHAGKVMNLDYLARAKALAKKHDLLTHLDGARVMNAAVAQRIDVARITRGFDSVSLCCSKGLGAPVGSLLCGSTTFITQARRWRKMVGGGMRQAGILAAAIDYALDHHIERLAQDHEHALSLQAQLSDIAQLVVESAHTNMLYMSFADSAVARSAQTYLRERGILIATGQRVRLVTHLNIQTLDLQRLVTCLKEFFR